MADEMKDELFEDVTYNEDLFEDTPYQETEIQPDVVDKAYAGLGTVRDILAKKTKIGDASKRFQERAMEEEKQDLVEAKKDSESYSPLESAGMGAVQGATLDFGDEIYGGLAAAKDVAFGPTELKNFLDKYKEERDIARAEFKQAEEENPASYMAGDIAGGIAPALISGGATAGAAATKVGVKEAAKQAAKVGAKYGAGVGLGRSEAELTEGELGSAAIDTGLGAAGGALGGAAFGAATNKMPDAINYLAQKGDKLRLALEDTFATPLYKKAAQAYKFAKENVPVWGSSAQKSHAQELNKKTNEVVKLLDDSRKEASKGIDDFFHKSEVKGLAKDYYGKLVDEEKGFQKLMEDPSPSVQKYAGEALSQIQQMKNKLYLANQIDDMGGSKQLGLANVRDLHNFKKELDRIAFNPRTIKEGKLAYKEISRFSKELENDIMGMLDSVSDDLYPELQKSMQKYTKMYKLGNELSDKGGKVISSGPMQDATKARVDNLVRKIILNKFKHSNEAVKQVDADKMYDTLIDNIQELAGKKMADKFKAETTKVGMLLNTVPKDASEVNFGGILRTISGGLAKGTVMTGTALGKASNVPKAVSNKITKKISEMTPKGVQALAANLNETQQKKYGKFFEELAGSSSTRKRALLFSASQDPEFREIIQEFIPFFPDLEADDE